MKSKSLIDNYCRFINAETRFWEPGRRSSAYNKLPEIHLVLYHTQSGCGILRQKKGRHWKETKLSRDMAFVFFSDEKIEWRAEGDGPWVFEFVNIVLNGQESLAREYIKRFGPTFQLQPVSPLARLVGECVSMSRNCHQNPTLFESCALAFRFLMGLFEHFVLEKEKNEENDVPLLIRQMEHFMRDDMRNILRVEDLSRRAQVSPSTLNRLFRKARAMTAMHRMMEIRLERARELLRSTNMPLKEIALTCGFSSLSYFCNVFRNKEGITPGFYRDNKKPNPAQHKQ